MTKKINYKKQYFTKKKFNISRYIYTPTKYINILPLEIEAVKFNIILTRTLLIHRKKKSTTRLRSLRL